MKILLHICCAPCAIYPSSVLLKEGLDITGFFYNPNIHPYLEYKKRLDTLKEFVSWSSLKIVYKDEYNLEEFLREVTFREEERCMVCYSMRLEAVGKYAKEGKFDCFTTTLLYSKFQKHDLIIDIAKTTAQKYNVPFYYKDFRDGWKEGIKICKEQGFYRQQYCGCVYSEKESAS
ncbi:MAG: epoxyqueuosine reductase QueH [bacterium]